jgi:transcriptional regulator with XRE-family HTH domain
MSSSSGCMGNRPAGAPDIAPSACTPPARGLRIEMALRFRGIRKQQALATELNVHESAITRWKSGDAISLDNVIALCALLDISADWLLMGRGTIDAHKNKSKPQQDRDAIESDAPVSEEARRLLQAFINVMAQDFHLKARIAGTR